MKRAHYRKVAGSLSVSGQLPQSYGLYNITHKQGSQLWNLYLYSIFNSEYLNNWHYHNLKISSNYSVPKLTYSHISTHNFNSFLAQQHPVGQGLLMQDVTHNSSEAPQSVGLLWTSDKLVAETST
jgi:hypothetical protein